jgi:hypothetical protein
MLQELFGTVTSKWSESRSNYLSFNFDHSSQADVPGVNAILNAIGMSVHVDIRTVVEDIADVASARLTERETTSPVGIGNRAKWRKSNSHAD